LSQWKPEVYTAVIDGKITQFRAEAISLEERMKYDGRNYPQPRGPGEVDREGN